MNSELETTAPSHAEVWNVEILAWVCDDCGRLRFQSMAGYDMFSDCELMCQCVNE